MINHIDLGIFLVLILVLIHRTENPKSEILVEIIKAIKISNLNLICQLRTRISGVQILLRVLTCLSSLRNFHNLRIRNFTK